MLHLAIFYEDSFDSAHFLPHVDERHKCRQLHGHTYRIRIELSGQIDENGWVLDYEYLKIAWKGVKNLLDHHTLNEIKGLDNPTCELIAMWIWTRLKNYQPRISRVELRETNNCGVVCDEVK